MDNIKYYKFGLDKYINQFESDKNSGLYEYRLILNELQKIDLYAKNGTLVVLNGLMTDKSIEDVELLIKNAHIKGAKAKILFTIQYLIYKTINVLKLSQKKRMTLKLMQSRIIMNLPN